MEQVSNFQFSEEEIEARNRAKKNIVWLSIVGVTMIFAGLTSAYIVSSADRFWVLIDLPFAFWISTAIILLSSLTFVLSIQAIKKDNRSQSNLFLVLTLVLGLGFAASQFAGWVQLHDSGNVVAEKVFNKNNPDQIFIQGEYGKDFRIQYRGEILQYDNGKFYTSKGELTKTQYAALKDTSNVASSYLWVLTALHLAHMLIAFIYLSRLIFRAVINKEFSSSNYLSMSLGANFWHFLGGLWIYLFLFLYLIH